MDQRESFWVWVGFGWVWVGVKVLCLVHVKGMKADQIGSRQIKEDQFGCGRGSGRHGWV